MLYYRFITALTDKPVVKLWLYNIFEFQRGIRNLIKGPMSGILASNVHTAAKYENLILFVGIVFLINSLSGLSYWVFKYYRLNFQSRYIDSLE